MTTLMDGPPSTAAEMSVPTLEEVSALPAAVLQARAREVFRAALEVGTELTGLELGAMHNRSERWGRDRAAEVRAELVDVDDVVEVPVARQPEPAAPELPDGPPETGWGFEDVPLPLPMDFGSAPAADVDEAAAAGSDVVPEPAAPSRVTAAAPVVDEDQADGKTPTRPTLTSADTVDEPRPRPVLPGRQVPAAAPAAPVAGAPRRRPRGRVVAWTGFVFGTLVSIGGNVLNAWLPLLAPAEGAPPLEPGWAPGLWQQVLAAVWPVALLLAVEVISRVEWPDKPAWKLLRWGGVGLVAFCAAIISYGHLYAVLDAAHYGAGAAVGPLALDGLMALCGTALLVPAKSSES